MDDYVFMVVDAFGTTYKIWADGRTEGFGPRASIVNKIPQHTHMAVATAMLQVAERMAVAMTPNDEVDHHDCL